MMTESSKADLGSGRVLLALVGLDEPTEAQVRRALPDPSGFALLRFPGMQQAREMLEEVAKATIVVTELSQLDKRLALPSTVRLIVLAGPDGRGAADVGADDVIRRPLRTEELRMRLRLSAKSLEADSAASAAERLAEALARQESGELVISSTEGSARVHLNHGRIAWVHRSHHNVSIKAILGDCAIEIDDESCRDLIEESRTSRRHFGDVLVEWGLAEASAIREALRRHVERELGLVLGWTDATATLLRDTRTLASGLSFRLDELGPGSRGRRRIHTQHDIPAVKPLPPRDREATEAWLDRVAAISELEGCALLDAKQGVVLGNRGTAEARLEVAWSMAASLAALGPGAEEVLASSSSMAYLLRPVPAPIGALAFVCFDAGKLSLALARILITKSGTT